MASRLKRNSAILAATVALVAGFEGLRTAAYRDPVGIPTICFGETRGVKMGDVETKDECKRMLGERLKEFERDMAACLTKPESLPDNVWAASLSLTYNIGAKAFCRSSIARLFNEGRIAEGCDAFLLYTKARGITLPGLVARRQKERAICKSYMPWK